MIASSEILFIINCHSGKKKAFEVSKQIEGVDSQVGRLLTDSLNDLQNIFERDLNTYKVFVAVGGDGSVREISRHILDVKDKYLAVLPRGSGNGFAKELGFRNNIKSLIEDIKKAQILDVDIISINNLNCINVAGIGIDALIADRFSKSLKRGFVSYLKISISSFFGFKPFFAKLKIGKQTLEGHYIMICFANTRQFGNNVFIAPNAKPNDGLFDIVLVKPIPIYKIPFFVLKLFFKNLKPSKYIEYISCKSAELETSFPLFHIDGDPIVLDKSPLEVSVKKEISKL